MKTKYFVWYGRNTSKQACASLAEVYAFVAYCLRENVAITGITKA
jgi:hypothetical protein